MTVSLPLCLSVCLSVSLACSLALSLSLALSPVCHKFCLFLPLFLSLSSVQLFRKLWTSNESIAHRSFLFKNQYLLNPRPPELLAKPCTELGLKQDMTSHHLALWIRRSSVFGFERTPECFWKRVSGGVHHLWSLTDVSYMSGNAVTAVGCLEPSWTPCKTRCHQSGRSTSSQHTRRRPCPPSLSSTSTTSLC